jgi:hypothetical protein
VVVTVLQEAQLSTSIKLIIIVGLWLESCLPNNIPVAASVVLPSGEVLIAGGDHDDEETRQKIETASIL